MSHSKTQSLYPSSPHGKKKFCTRSALRNCARQPSSNFKKKRQTNLSGVRRHCCYNICRGKPIYSSTEEFIAIEGNIGAGKTTFTHQLHGALSGTLLLENFYDNPYLADFYQDPEAFALKVETAFLEERVGQLSSFFKQKNDSPIIADFSLEKSLLFAQQNLSEVDFTTYKKEYINASTKLPQPDLVLFLAQSIPQLQKNIQKRGRDFEQCISDQYLQKIENGYLQWQKNSTLNICELNTKGMDFIQDKDSFYSLLATFFRA